MKAFIQGGSCLLWGWLALNAHAQDLHWKASTPANARNVTAVSHQQSSANGPGMQNAGTAPARLGSPVPLDASGPGAAGDLKFRQTNITPASMIIRAQAPEDKLGPSLPKLDAKPPVQKPTPPPPLLKKEGEFTPPPPTPMPPTLRPSTPMSSMPMPSMPMPSMPMSSMPMSSMPMSSAPFTVMPMPYNPVWDSVGMPGGDVSLGLDGSCCPSCPSDCGQDFDCGPQCGQHGAQSCFASAGCCPDRGRFWATAAYLMWYQRADTITPLVTSSRVGTNNDLGGILGLPTTRVLYDELPNTIRSGARFDLGMWLDHFPNIGINVNMLFLGHQDKTATYSSTGNPYLYRPFIDAKTGKKSSEIVAGPGKTGDPNFYVGSVSVHNFSQLWGMEANVRYKCGCGPNYWLDALVGYRHLNLSEGIDITENPTPLAPGAIGFLVHDSFQTRNQFNGIQVGLDGEYRCKNHVFIGATAKVAFGATHQIVQIDGSTAFSTGTTLPGGLLALPGTNIGKFTNDRFAVLPELGLKVGLDLTENLRVFVGYDFIYLSSVVRPGDQIDPVVNKAFQPTAVGPGIATGAPRPAVLFRTSDFWAQGLNFGVQYRY